MDGNKTVTAVFSMDYNTDNMDAYMRGTGKGHINTSLNPSGDYGWRFSEDFYYYQDVFFELYTGVRTVTFYPRPEPGWYFVGWRGACAGFGTGNCTLVMNTDKYIEAVFSQQPPSNTGSCEPRNFSPRERQVLDTYIAYYGRFPDVKGFAWWVNHIDSMGGDLSAIIDTFANSDENRQRFGSMEINAFINNLYQQIYGRSADAGGLGFFKKEHDSGRLTRARMALNILDGALPPDDRVLNNRRLVSGHYVTWMENRGAAAVALDANTSAKLLDLVKSSASDASDLCEAMTKQLFKSNRE